MALSPIKSAEDRATRTAAAIQPTKTYAFDMDTGEIGGLIDGTEAIRQFIRKAIATARYRYTIYDGSYGCELESLIGQDVPTSLLQAEIPRMISECILYDERINDVYDFAITRSGDSLYVEFKVDTTVGVLEESVVV